MQFTFYEPVNYLDHKACFPKTGEHSGQFVGIAKNKGDAPTYWILNNDNQLLARSVVQSTTGEDPNLQATNPQSLRGVMHQIPLHLA